MSLVVFEDFVPGEIRTYGDYAFSTPEIVAFAANYDPQPFHLDPAAGKKAIFGGLAASGWHTCSALMRMMFDGWLAETSYLAGIGVEENRWLAPVRPGDCLSARTQTLEKIDLRSRPDAGIVKFTTTLHNKSGKEVMTQTMSALFARREPLAHDALVAPSPKEPPQPVPERIDDPLATLPDCYAKVRVGAYAELGETHFTLELIRDYAEKFDPFPFHIEEGAGRAHLFGAVSAGGWHTAASWMQHLVGFRRQAANGAEVVNRASPGISDLAWRNPVLAGDNIVFSTQIVGKRPTSKPNLGLIRSRNCGVNQRGDVVLEFYASAFAPLEEK
jgi:acyl dehydratase